MKNLKQKFLLANCKVDPTSGINECDSKDEAIVENEETETTTEYAYDYPILENKQKNETVEKGEDNSIETDDTDEYDSILDDIFY